MYDSRPPSLDQFTGCLLGLALGDALGAPFEGGWLERGLWRRIGTTRDGEMRWTDDTQMSLDLAESLLANGALDADDLAQRFARSYHWSRGYGPGAAKLLKRIAHGQPWQQANTTVYPNGSYGNGGAMRAPVLALAFAQPAALSQAVQTATRITHAHPLGIEGAQLIAHATTAALCSATPTELLAAAAAQAQQSEFQCRLQCARDWLSAATPPSARQVARELGNGIQASTSCVTAIYLAARFLAQPFVELNAFTRQVGGDVDTIGAMSGAIWGAARGQTELPQTLLAKLEQRERLERVAVAICHSPKTRPLLKLR